MLFHVLQIGAHFGQVIGDIATGAKGAITPKVTVKLAPRVIAADYEWLAGGRLAGLSVGHVQHSAVIV
jgi:hypothetical protein